MSVLIKGMAMPKSCEKCKLDLRKDACRAFDEWHEEHPYSIRATDRLPDCPMVEVKTPHGRLIDADACVEYVQQNNAYAWEALAYADAVIEAED